MCDDRVIPSSMKSDTVPRYNDNFAPNLTTLFRPISDYQLGFSAIFLAVCYAAEVVFYPEKLDTACQALRFVRIASSSPRASSPFRSLARSLVSQLSLASVSTLFPSVLTLPSSSCHPPSRLTFLTKSEITFVTRNSARPNPSCIELALSFYF